MQFHQNCITVDNVFDIWSINLLLLVKHFWLAFTKTFFKKEVLHIYFCSSWIFNCLFLYYILYFLYLSHRGTCCYPPRALSSFVIGPSQAKSTTVIVCQHQRALSSTSKVCHWCDYPFCDNTIINNLGGGPGLYNDGG